MKHHSELLNYLAGKIKARRYLEIGVQNPKNNFDKINVPIKIGVDPLPVCDGAGLKNTTSDQFFCLYFFVGYQTVNLLGLVVQVVGDGELFGFRWDRYNYGT